ncbi:MAG: hypothetical protein ACPG8N_01205 [Rhodothermales bacterium]
MHSVHHIWFFKTALFKKVLPTFQMAAFLVMASGLGGCGDGGVSGDGGLTIPQLVEPLHDSDTPDAVLFSWEEATTVRYHIQIAEDQHFSRLLIDELTGYRSFFPARDLPMDAHLFWRVRSESDTKASSWSTARSFHVVSHAHPPAAPRLTVPDDGTLDLERSVRLEWTPVPDAYSYHLVVTIDEDMYLFQADLENLPDPFFELEGLIFTYPYWWKVRALGPAGYSEWSPVWIFWVTDGD